MLQNAPDVQNACQVDLQEQIQRCRAASPARAPSRPGCAASTTTTQGFAGRVVRCSEPRILTPAGASLTDGSLREERISSVCASSANLRGFRAVCSGWVHRSTPESGDGSSGGAARRGRGRGRPRAPPRPAACAGAGSTGGALAAAPAPLCHALRRGRERGRGRRRWRGGDRAGCREQPGAAYVHRAARLR